MYTMPFQPNGRLLIEQPQPEHSALSVESAPYYADTRFRLEQTERYQAVDTLFRRNPLFPHVPRISDICQSGFGNCFLLAPLQALVERNPLYITRIMQLNNQNRVVV